MKCLGFVALLLVTGAVSAGTTAPPAPPPVDCHDATHRAPGFWIGHWAVSATGSKTTLATSHIEWILGGCAFKETYAQTIGPGIQPMNYHGTSYTAYDANHKTWRQFYVDDSGNASHLHGGIKDNAMVLMTDGPGRINRMTVSAQPDGSVRQHGEFSLDGGMTWKTGYDFTYRRVDGG